MYNISNIDHPKNNRVLSLTRTKSIAHSTCAGSQRHMRRRDRLLDSNSPPSSPNKLIIKIVINLTLPSWRKLLLASSSSETASTRGPRQPSSLKGRDSLWMTTLFFIAQLGRLGNLIITPQFCSRMESMSMGSGRMGYLMDSMCLGLEILFCSEASKKGKSKASSS